MVRACRTGTGLAVLGFQALAAAAARDTLPPEVVLLGYTVRSIHCGIEPEDLKPQPADHCPNPAGLVRLKGPMRLVVKVGTSLIAPGGQIDANLLRAMVDQFDLSRNEYLIVTSGAIEIGRAHV